MFDTKEALVSAIYKCLPYSNQITNLDFTSVETAVYFTWRGNDFRVSLSGHSEEVQGSILTGSDLCLLFNELLKQA